MGDAQDLLSHYRGRVIRVLLNIPWKGGAGKRNDGDAMGVNEIEVDGMG
jgi:hypothetical protein